MSYVKRIGCRRVAALTQHHSSYYGYGRLNVIHHQQQRNISDIGNNIHKRVSSSLPIKNKIINKTSIINGYNNNNNNIMQLYYKQNRGIWIPPIWLRPLLRPLAVIIASFIGGAILQLMKGTPAKHLLAAAAEEQAASGAAGTSASAAGSIGGGGGSPLFGRIVGGSVLLAGLYFTRLHNPFYSSLIGEKETNLQLAESHASLSIQYYFDSRSASDSLIPRLKAMENCLGIAMSLSQKDNKNNDDKNNNIYQRVEKIRKKGYTNAVKVSLSRAEHYATAGELEKFAKTIQKTNDFVSEGGDIDPKELDRVKKMAYGKKSDQLMALAQTLAHKGDVSGCSNALSEINDIRNIYSGISITQDDIKETMNRAHSHHITHILNEARTLKEQGSRRQAQMAIERAQTYASLNNVPFPQNQATEILA